MAPVADLASRGGASLAVRRSGSYGFLLRSTPARCIYHETPALAIFGACAPSPARIDAGSYRKPVSSLAMTMRWISEVPS